MTTLLIIHLLLAVICFVVHWFWWASLEERRTNGPALIIGLGIISLIPIVNVSLIIQWAWEFYKDNKVNKS